MEMEGIYYNKNNFIKKITKNKELGFIYITLRKKNFGGGEISAKN